MEFYVVDPKDVSFNDWAIRVREFLSREKMRFVERDGALCYRGDDVAAVWEENSVLFEVKGEISGCVELRDSDRGFYVFTEDLGVFDEREVVDAVGMMSRSAGAVYGFTWNDRKCCRFHLGPSAGFHYFYDEEDADYPPRLDLEDTWGVFFRASEWIGDNVNRLHGPRGVNPDTQRLDFEVEVTFTHPASLDGLNEILVEEEGFERTRGGLRAVFRQRNARWIRRFVSLLPPDAEDFDRAFFRAVWRGTFGEETREIFSVGVERRNLRPFIQLPVHGTTKALLDRFKANFKGHRIDRQEYYL